MQHGHFGHFIYPSNSSLSRKQLIFNFFLLRLLLVKKNRKSKIKNDNNNNSLDRRYSKLYVLFICLLLQFVCLFFLAGGVCGCGCLGFYLLYHCCCCFLCFVGCRPISFLRVGAEHHIMKYCYYLTSYFHVH